MAIKIMNIEQNTFSDNLDKISHSVYIFYLYDSYLLYLQVILSLLDKTLEKKFYNYIIYYRCQRSICRRSQTKTVGIERQW
jgi:hypothetical protein